MGVTELPDGVVIVCVALTIAEIVLANTKQAPSRFARVRSQGIPSL